MPPVRIDPVCTPVPDPVVAVPVFPVGTGADATCTVDDIKFECTTAPSAKEMVVGLESGVESKATEILGYVAKVIRQVFPKDVLAARRRVDEDRQLVEIRLDIPSKNDVQAAAFDQCIGGIQFATATEPVGIRRIPELRFNRLDGEGGAIIGVDDTIDDDSGTSKTDGREKDCVGSSATTGT